MQRLSLDQRINLIDGASRAYRLAIEQTPGFATSDCSRKILDAVLCRLDASLHQPFLLVGLAASYWHEHPEVVREAFSETFARADAVEWGIASYVFLMDGGNPFPECGYMRRGLSELIDDRIWTDIVLRVPTEAPDDSRAYVSAALALLDEARSAVAIREFRAVWSSLAPERREAI